MSWSSRPSSAIRGDGAVVQVEHDDIGSQWERPEHAGAQDAAGVIDHRFDGLLTLGDGTQHALDDSDAVVDRGTAEQQRTHHWRDDFPYLGVQRLGQHIEPRRRRVGRPPSEAKPDFGLQAPDEVGRRIL